MLQNPPLVSEWMGARPAGLRLLRRRWVAAGSGGSGRPTGGWREACGVKVAAVPLGGGRARW